MAFVIQLDEDLILNVNELPACIDSRQVSKYTEALSAEDRVRYLSKLTELKTECPYATNDKHWYKGNEVSRRLLEITFADVTTYLIHTKCAYSVEDVRAYKSLLAFKRVECGMLGNVSLRLLDSGICILKAQVTHSMAMSQTPLCPWIAISPIGTPLCAHCTCRAGLSEVCSHVSTLLFAAVKIQEYREMEACTEQEVWWLEKYKKPETIPLISQLNTAKAHTRHCLMAKEASEEERKQLLKTMLDLGNKSCLGSVLRDFCHQYVPEESRFPLPETLSESLYTAHQTDTCINDLLEIGEKFMSTYKMTQREVLRLEELTRAQYRQRLWFSHRAGRITSSVIHSVLRQDPAHPCKSTLQRICYPHRNIFSNSATRWGIENEEVAVKKLASWFQTKCVHSNFSIKEVGLVVSLNHPYLAATPDRILYCDCHGRAVIEVKCPYKYRDSVLDRAMRDTDFFLVLQDGDLRLKKNHSYYTQIQYQMFVLDIALGYFVIYTKLDLCCIMIERDVELAAQFVPKAKLYFLHAIVPELSAKFHTRTRFIQEGGTHHQTENTDMLPGISKTSATLHVQIILPSSPTGEIVQQEQSTSRMKKPRKRVNKEKSKVTSRSKRVKKN